MAEKDLKVLITGDASGLFNALGAASKATEGLAKDMQAAIGGIQKMFLGFTAVLGGATFLKETVAETKTWTVEAQKLARVLGITTQQASILNLAIGDIYGTQEEYLGAVGKLTKSLNANEEAFAKLGVETRDQNGRLRDTPSIMAEVNAALMTMKSGTDRNIASAQIYGKSWMEVQRYLKLTPEVLEEARKKAEKLNLIVGTDAVAAADAYRASMNDLEDTVKALKLRIGQELMPLMTEFNNAAAEKGPEALTTLGISINLVVTAFKSVVFAVEAVIQAIITMGQSGGAMLGGIWDAMGWVTIGQFGKAKEAIKTGYENATREMNAGNMVIQRSFEKMGLELNQMWDPSLRPRAKGKAGDGATGAASKGGGEDVDPYDAFEAQMRAEAKVRKERLALWDKHQADMYEIFGDALDVQIKKLNDHYDEVLNRERDFGADEEVLQRIEVERTVAIEQAKTDAAAKAAEERKRIAEEEAAEARRVLEETGTAQQGFFDGMQQYLQKQGTTFQMWAQGVQQMLQGVTSAFAAGIAGILSGQMSLSQGMKTIWKGIVQAVIQAIAQLIAKWIVMTVVKKALGIEEAATDGGRTAGALTTAAAQTWAAYSGIPFVGPALALAQISLMYASMGASMAASEGIGVGVAATARKVGGRVDRPEFTLLGEAGPEIVAPESDFRDYTRSILSLGANLGANLSAADAQVMGYGRAASGFASSRAGMDGGQLAPVMINVQGHILDTSQRGARQFGEMVVDGARAAVRERSVVLRTAEVFGGI